MGKFITECGKSFECDHDCFMTGIIIESIYPKPMKAESSFMSDKCKECKALKKSRNVLRVTNNLKKEFETKDTVCFAKNVNFTELKITGEYDTPCMNLKQVMLIEFILHTEDFRAYIYIKCKGSQNMSFLDVAESLLEDWWEELKEKFDNDEDEICIHMCNMETGSVDLINVESFDELKNMIISMKLVKYESEIVEDYDY